HQAVSTNTPPASPEIFNPDPNKLNLPEPPQTDFNWTRRVVVSTNPAPSATFNPDPGASLRQPTNAPDTLFNEPVLPPLFTPPEIPGDKSLPRENVRAGEIFPPTNPPPRSYGSGPLTNGLALPRENTRRELKIYQDFRVPDYSLREMDYPTNTERPDRWRIGFVPWKRYTSGVSEQPYETPEPLLWAPYKQSVLKGDVPVIGQDIFLNLTASSETVTEFRNVPTASGISGAVPGEYEFYGQSDEISIQNNFAFDMDLFQGETAFRPVDWAIKLEPVFNVNYLDVREAGVVSPDPRGSIGGNNNTPPPNNGFVINPGDIGSLLNGQVGPASSYRDSKSTQRTKTYFALQQGFVEFHLKDLSDNYDFVSLRVGIQPFNADFRGFLFNDVNLGARLFGNLDNNLFQYNLAVFDMREKDTDSELNTLDNRNQEVIIANLYRQDFIWPGYTEEWSFLANLDHGGTHYDDNGNLVRPEPLGTVRPHDENVYYLGWGGDGHIGRLNISHQFYQAFGHDDFNGLAGQPVNINAQMAALEVSYDHNWARYKASFFYASGDGNATDGHGNGFDTIVDNPNFTGGPFSFWARQGFNLGGTAINLKDPSSLVPDLRSSKTEGQANFVNPGVFIYGLGAEFDLTPKLRSFLNANYIRFANTDAIKTALLTAKVDNEVGYDLSIGFQYRPLLTDNIIVSAGFGVLIPGRGYRDIYRANTVPVPGFDNGSGGSADFPYSGLIAITFTY
ncbi:MAG TPA: hypothetical protein VHX90_03450, partial [Verrucomicrobiae bacterium]|nr:hypothetical protein [Verrucomicrobiae bacterium]